MTHAELLRKDAKLAMDDGGMFYSGECLSRMADAAESIEAENAKLRELASILRYCMQVNADCDGCKLNGAKGEFVHDPLLACDGLHDRMRELGVDA